MSGLASSAGRRFGKIQSGRGTAVRFVPGEQEVNVKQTNTTTDNMIDAEEAKRLVASYMAKGLIIPPPKLKKEPQNRQDYGQGTCVYCSKEYKRKSKDSIFCSRTCYETKRRREKQALNGAFEEIPCIYCGTKFLPKNRNTQRYCTPECAVEAYNSRRTAKK